MTPNPCGRPHAGLCTSVCRDGKGFGSFATAVVTTGSDPKTAIEAARRMHWPDLDEAVRAAQALGCTCESPIWGEHWPGIRPGAEPSHPTRDKRCPLAICRDDASQRERRIAEELSAARMEIEETKFVGELLKAFKAVKGSDPRALGLSSRDRAIPIEAHSCVCGRTVVDDVARTVTPCSPPCNGQPFNARVAKLLREIEFHVTVGGGGAPDFDPEWHVCPKCARDGQHAPDCALAALLREAEGK